MNFLEFLPYHNRLIKFRYKGETLEGVVIDEIPYKSKKKESEFSYISRKHLKRWKEADNKGDQTSKEKLQEIIDIEEIKNIPEKLSDELEKINNKIFDGVFLNLPLEYNFKKKRISIFF